LISSGIEHRGDSTPGVIAQHGNQADARIQQSGARRFWGLDCRIARPKHAQDPAPEIARKSAAPGSFGYEIGTTKVRANTVRISIDLSLESATG
jgi:hypothetical protein